MKFLYRDWTNYPRRFPFYLPVSRTNFLAAKDYWIRRSINEVSISFLFRGKGIFYMGRQADGAICHQIEAPCIVIKLPHHYCEYGPASAEDAWDELFINYEERLIPLLKASRLLDVRQPVLPMGNAGGVWALAEELFALLSADPVEDYIDVIDRVCERMLLEGMTPDHETNLAQRTVNRVLTRMRKSLHQPFDIQEAARLCGMSESTFRRLWSQIIAEPPRRHLETLRIQEACRALVHSDQPIKEIAHRLGFEDELYFSRRFQRRCGVSPRLYRERHRT